MASDVSSDHARVFVPPPLIYLAIFLAGIGLQRYVPVPQLPIAAGRVMGPIFELVGIGLIASSFRRFRASATSVVPVRPTTALVIEGPYRVTRNPMYLGMLLVYAGVACWFGLVWPLLLAPVLIWVIAVFVIRREERYLARKFGDEYQRYRAHVRRWL
jgi:protein-S-isoprenylcysteine O-methyltransferase Ste14